MKLEQIVHRVATDADFAAAARRDLEGTLAREGIEVAPAELAALQAALRGASEEAIRPSGAGSLDVWHSPQFEPQSS